MQVGYPRVSKWDGRHAKKLPGGRPARVRRRRPDTYEDAASAAATTVPACVKTLREGDTLVVGKFDPLGRDLRHLVNTVHEPTACIVGFRVPSGHGATVDTTPRRLAMAAMDDRDTVVGELCTDPAFTRQSLRRHVGPDGTPPARRPEAAGRLSCGPCRDLQDEDPPWTIC